MRRAAGTCLGLASYLTLSPSCRAPTEITIDVSTDIRCPDLGGSSITVGLLHEIETAPPTTTSTSCGASGNLGALVVVPSGDKGEALAFKVIAGFDRDVLSCAPPYGKGCVVARREIRFVPHTPLRISVPLRASCDGIPCGETETCVAGACVPAQIADPNACTGSGCGESSLGPEALDGGAGGDAAGLPDGGANPDAPPSAYSDMGQAANWSTFDPNSVVGGLGLFQGGTFDGRYVYFFPNLNGTGFQSIAARYDSFGAFSARTSWATFDAKTIGAGAFFGGAFDGRYVYMVPYFNGGSPTGVAARCDTQGVFGDGRAWATFDLSTVNAGAKFLSGSVFDGRYVYMVGSNIVTRYDTLAAFTTAASWSAFDTTTVNAAAKGFVGGVFDGRYLYLAPSSNTAPDVVPRYDTRAAFGDPASWAAFEVTSVNASAKGFRGAAFDGRYVYLVPFYNGAYDGIVARYDTQNTFANAGSWATFDVATVNANAKGFSGAGFDGRYVYLVPLSSGFNGALARYDTQAAFTAAAAWSTFDVSTLNAAAKGFGGAVFDGRYLYLLPANGGLVARFDAKSPPAMPNLPAFSGSFL